MTKLNKSQSGIAHLAIILVVIVLAAVGGVGYKVWKNKQDKDKNAKEQASQQVKPEEKIENKIPDGFVEYKNTELGLAFIYPKEWGDVKVSNNDGALANKFESGMRYSFNFTKEEHAQVGVAVKDFKVLAAKDGPCSAQGFAEYKELEKPGDGVGSGGYLNLTSRLLLNENKVQVMETYQPGGGICSGLTIWGQKQFDGKRYNGANASYYLSDIKNGDDDVEVDKLVKMYKEDPTSILSNKVRDQIVEVTKSLSEL